MTLPLRKLDDVIVPKNLVVIMFEKSLDNENLDAAGQINEVFGPFSEDEVNAWAERADQMYKGTRQWLIIPLSSPNIFPERN